MRRIARARNWGLALCCLLAAADGLLPMAVAQADNNRLNYSVFTNIYTAQKQNGCITDAEPDRRLVVAAQRYTLDALNNRNLDDEFGSDGSTTADRARDAGFTGKVAQTVAINPALAISGIEILGQWYGDPVAWATMRDCQYTAIGVWSESTFDRTVVVAVYGSPA